jgi:CRISPR system Cascade subunit CasA
MLVVKTKRGLTKERLNYELKDKFISTTSGKVSLKTILTREQDYQLQYFFDEIQLAMLQLLSSLATVVLHPTVAELKAFLKHGVSEQQYDDALNKVSSEWFESDYFMQSKPPADAKWPEGPITKMLSGIECGSGAK